MKLEKCKNQITCILALLSFLMLSNFSTLVAQTNKFIRNSGKYQITGPWKEFWERFLIESTNNLPTIGEEVTIKLKYKPSSNYGYIPLMSLELPQNCVLVSGNTLLMGEMIKDKWIELNTTVKFLEKERSVIHVNCCGFGADWYFYVGGAFLESEDLNDLRYLIKQIKKRVEQIKTNSPLREGISILRMNPNELIDNLQYSNLPCEYDRLVLEETDRKNKELYKQLTQELLKELDSLEVAIINVEKGIQKENEQFEYEMQRAIEQSRKKNDDSTRTGEKPRVRLLDNSRRSELEDDRKYLKP